jgi:hypothetical protein
MFAGASDGGTAQVTHADVSDGGTVEVMFAGAFDGAIAEATHAGVSDGGTADATHADVSEGDTQEVMRADVSDDGTAEVTRAGISDGATIEVGHAVVSDSPTETAHAVSGGPVAEVNASVDPGHAGSPATTAAGVTFEEADRILTFEETHETHEAGRHNIPGGGELHSSARGTTPQVTSEPAPDVDSAGDETSDASADAIGDDDDAEDDELSADGDDSHEMVAGPRGLDD